MKIYVDETPKDCWDCPMHDGENGWCKMLVCYTDYVPKDCPLQSVTDYTKQVRAEVVEEIKAELNKQKLVMKSDFRPREEEAIPWQDIVAILDQVKGESNVKN